MREDLMIEAGVSLECRNCGSELVIDAAALAAKAVMLAAATGRKDVKTD